ncbi:14873_t:CDS:2, partial [Acaulospora morrowiae]
MRNETFGVSDDDMKCRVTLVAHDISPTFLVWEEGTVLSSTLFHISTRSLTLRANSFCLDNNGNYDSAFSFSQSHDDDKVHNLGNPYTEGRHSRIAVSPRDMKKEAKITEK